MKYTTYTTATGTAIVATEDTLGVESQSQAQIVSGLYAQLYRLTQPEVLAMETPCLDLFQEGVRDVLGGCWDEVEAKQRLLAHQLKDLGVLFDKAREIAAEMLLNNIEMQMNICIDSIEKLEIYKHEVIGSKIEEIHNRVSPLEKKGWTFDF